MIKHVILFIKNKSIFIGKDRERDTDFEVSKINLFFQKEIF